jgi:hypothetical protein
MPIHNGGVVDKVLYAKGDVTWADKTDWSAYTKWIEYTDTTIETETGAKGQPLRWQSDVMDLGIIKNVYPEVRVQTDGTPKVVVEYSTTSSDLSSATNTINVFTSDNTTTGTLFGYAVLDHMQPGYTDAGVTSESTQYHPHGIVARYVRITVYVEKFLPDGTRGQAFITNVNTRFLNDTIDRTYSDADQGTFVKRTDLTPDQWAPPQYGLHDNIVSLQITPHYSSGNEDVKPLITSKAGGGRFTMMDSSAGVVATWTADITIKTLPDIRETVLGIEKAN